VVDLPLANIQVSGPLMVLLGLVIGILSGFFGVGGGFLLTPMLNALFGIPYTVAVGSSLSQMVGLSATASIRHARLGNIDYRLGMLMLVGSALGAEGGAEVLGMLKRLGAVSVFGVNVPLITLVMSLVYVVLLSSVGLSVGLEALRCSRRGECTPAEPRTPIMDSLRRVRLAPLVSLPASGIPSMSAWIVIGVGVLIGFLSGMLGVGGGFILMPLLIYAIGCPTVIAIGTGMFQTIFTAAYGSYTHAMRGHVDLPLVLLMLLGSSVGAHIGAGLTRRFDAARVRGGFAILTGVGVIIVLAKLVSVFTGG